MLVSKGFKDGMRCVFRKGMTLLCRLGCRLEKERDSGKRGDYFALFMEEVYVAQPGVKPLQMYLGDKINRAGVVGCVC